MKGAGNMNRKKNVLPTNAMLDDYARLLREDPRIRSLPLVVSGSSMNPFLVHGRDTVHLSRLTRPVRRGDILLYRRDNGAYILHRVWKVEAAGCTMVGDNQQQLEPGIRYDQIAAIVTAVDRKGKRMEPGSFWWVFFEKVWIRMVPLRPALRRLYGICCAGGRKLYSREDDKKE